MSWVWVFYNIQVFNSTALVKQLKNKEIVHQLENLKDYRHYEIKTPAFRARNCTEDNIGPGVKRELNSGHEVQADNETPEEEAFHINPWFLSNVFEFVLSGKIWFVDIFQGIWFFHEVIQKEKEPAQSIEYHQTKDYFPIIAKHEWRNFPFVKP